MDDEDDQDLPDVGDLEGEETQDGEKGPVTSQPEATNGTIPMPMPSSSPKTTNPHSPSSPIPQPDHTEKSPLKNTPDQAAPPSYDSVFPTGTQQKGEEV